MTIETIRTILEQSKDLGSVEWVYFEGGEPFLYYAALLKGVRLTAESGFRVGLVSNSYWATSEEDALENLRPFVGLIDDLSISSDLFHYEEKHSRQSKYVQAAAKKLGIALGVVCIASPNDEGAKPSLGKLPDGESALMFRGRAVEKLASSAPKTAWQQFTECPHEGLTDPGRVHVDPLGYVHICQGISMGNVFLSPIKDICATFDPRQHPIVGPILAGGPAELARRYQVSTETAYADACHLCYEARRMLRPRFPDILAPDQMYGDISQAV
jgi:MoaA/NifB/PqqE/SkfB family radical SAM enzyme